MSRGDKWMIVFVVACLCGGAIAAATDQHQSGLRRQQECRSAFAASRSGSDSLNILRVAPHCAEVLP